ncbi:MAG: LPS assembly lipoprotein LptE [Pseudomonadota bacterium]|nr:LPS assembly lipoprotein LptE [Pseudomonadota bacterium]
MRTNLLILPLLILTLLLAACGFHLRGQGGFTFPFQTLFILSPNANAPFIVDLKRTVQLYNIKLADSSANAQLTLHIVSETMSKQILSLSDAGRVREYQLNYRVSLRAYDIKLDEWVPADEIVLQRYLSYDNTQVLAKEMEETLLYQDMRNDAVQQILRRLSLAKPPPSPQ